MLIRRRREQGAPVESFLLESTSFSPQSPLKGGILTTRGYLPHAVDCRQRRSMGLGRARQLLTTKAALYRRMAKPIWRLLAYRALTGLAIVSLSQAASAYPGRVEPNDGLSCSGRLVLIGDSKVAVLDKCGQPQRVEHGCVPGRRSRSLWCWDIWTYRPDANCFPRYVSFDNEFVTGIRAGSRFD